MLGIKSIAELAQQTESTPRQLYEVADHVDDFVQFYELSNPAAPHKKPRIVLNPTGALRRIQTNLLRNIFRPKLWPSRHSFGGVPGRNAVQNASRHSHSRFIYTTDIENFFPSINFHRVRDLFSSQLDCSDDIALLLARLCTHNKQLAQGLIASPILADRVVRRVDARIAGLAEQHQLVYTRFVDDISISGRFSLDRTTSSLVELIRKIVIDCGFRVAIHKEQSGPLAAGEVSITGLRVINGHLDPVAEYVQQLETLLEAHRILGTGGDFNSMLFTKSQLKGRVDYVCSINANRRRTLRARAGAIDWGAVQRHAIERGLLVCRKVLKKVSGPSEPFPEDLDAQSSTRPTLVNQ